MSTSSMTCELFESHLGEYLDNELDATTRAACAAHVATCTQCTALLAELDELVVSATRLPLPVPSRDLWPSIEARLDTPVRSIASVSTPAHPFMTWRRLSIAAVALVSVSAGLTWSIARRAPALVPEAANVATLNAGPLDSSPDTPAADDARVREIQPSSPMVDGMPPAVMGGALSNGERSGLVASGTGAAGRSASGTPMVAASSTGRVLALDTLYGREIAMLRTVAETQLGLLDSSTVAVVRRNLDIIDNAIVESRRALANDPNSGFLLDQLDRAYERKVDLLRQLALL